MNRRGRFLAIACLAAVTLACVLTVVFVLLSMDGGRPEPKVTRNLTYLPLLLVVAVTGALIVSRRPDNRIGVGMCLIAILGSFIAITGTYVDYSLTLHSGDLPLTDLSAWSSDRFWVWIVVPPMTLLPLVCPHGDLPSPGWRPALYLTFTTLAVLTVSESFRVGPLDDYPAITNPLGLEALAPVLEPLNLVGYLLLLASVACSALALIHRFRHSQGVERQQLKWLVIAAIAVFMMFILNWTLGLLISYPNNIDLWNYLWIPAISCFPVATGIAILRHNLYDIDRIINRTLVYGLLTATLAVVYFGLVVGLQALLSSLSGGSGLAIVLTTLAVAALFMPARGRIQSAVDRRFNRRQYDAARTIDAFSARLREQIDMDTLRGELLTVLDETMQPSAASLWLRSRNVPGSLKAYSEP